MIPDEIIQKVRESANIAEVVGEIVTLKRAGASLKGLCPFHGEKTPSFVVNTQQGTYHCFGCQAHGDSLTFIKETQNLNFPEAVRALALRVGIEVPEERPLRPEARKAKAKKLALEERLFDIQEHLTQWYSLNLNRSSIALNYLNERQIKSESAQAFRLGWASDDVAHFVRWMNEHEVALSDLEILGVVIPFDPEQPNRRGDQRLNGGRLRFRNRLMCPIFDMRDRVVGYSGRVIRKDTKAPKYLNSPETPLFTKSEHLFGLKTARVAMRSTHIKDLILCEGNLDVITLWQVGFPNTVAAMGTALSERQAQIIKRLSTSVTCVMDGDQAGQKAAFKSLPILLAQGLDVRGKPLPNDQDPDSFIRTYGSTSFREWLSYAQPLLLVRLESLIHEHRQDPIGQAAIVKELIPLVSLIADEHQRPLFLDVISKAIQVDRSYLSNLLVKTLEHKRSQLTEEQSSPYHRQNTQNNHEPNNYGYPDEFYDEYPSNDFTRFEDQRKTPFGAKQLGQSSRKNIKRKKKLSSSQTLSHDRPWWTKVTIQRGADKVRPRQFGDRPSGEVEIKLAPIPQPPKPLQSSAELEEQISPLNGYEREAISTLFYQPELLDSFLERGVGDCFSHSGVYEFLMSLKHEKDTGKFSTGEIFLKECPDLTLVTVLKECIAHPPLQNDKIDPKRNLNEIIRRLKQGKLQLKLQRITHELKTLPAQGQNDDFSIEQETYRADLLKSYQETQTLLQQLLQSRQSS